MNSISNSEHLVEIQDLHMVFKTRFHHDSMRDLFVSMLKDPLGNFLDSEERLHILKGINLKVKKGDIIGVLGVNGSGKTTLCRVISGTYFPTQGTVKTQGRVKAVFDTQIGINDELTGRENAFLLAALMYPDVENQEALVEEALEFSELGEFQNMPFKKYSKGMQARLFLSLISSLPSDVLVLDEVFDGADLFFQEKVAKRVLKMIEQSGAVIFVSHSPERVFEVCNRVIVINDGQVAFDGDPKNGTDFYIGLKKLAR